jgi:hypothetical protein
VPRDRVAALQKAFMDTFADQQFKDDADKAGFEVEPNTPQQLAAIVDDVLKMDPTTLAKLKEVLK